MTSFCARQCGAGTNSHDSIKTENHVVASKPEARPCVSAGLQEKFTVQTLNPSEIDRHISDCRYLRNLARCRFNGSHNPADKAEADRWDALMVQAILDRRTQREAEIADEATFGGTWTDEVLNRSATHFNVTAGAVRRRMGALK